jgi:hypothetical protein
MDKHTIINLQRFRNYASRIFSKLGEDDDFEDDGDEARNVAVLLMSEYMDIQSIDDDAEDFTLQLNKSNEKFVSFTVNDTLVYISPYSDISKAMFSVMNKLQDKMSFVPKLTLLSFRYRHITWYCSECEFIYGDQLTPQTPESTVQDILKCRDTLSKLEITDNIHDDGNNAYTEDMNKLQSYKQYLPILLIGKLSNIINGMDAGDRKLRHNNLWSDNIICSESGVYFVDWKYADYTCRMTDEAILLTSDNPHIWKHLEFKDCDRLRLDILLVMWYKSKNKNLIVDIAQHVIASDPLSKWKHKLTIQ